LLAGENAYVLPGKMMKWCAFCIVLALCLSVGRGFQGRVVSRTRGGESTKYMVATRNSRSDMKATDPYPNFEQGSGRRDDAHKSSTRAMAHKQTPLTQRSGARPLTKIERKAKEMYEGQLNQVERAHAPGSRVSLSELIVGQKMRGRIISVKDFGLFVDVGSRRDGLVHIKDVSKDYFISQLETKFVPGQDVDVWVKFCEAKKYKLGLQMYPVTDLSAARNYNSLGSSKAHRGALLSGQGEMSAAEATSLAVRMAKESDDDGNSVQDTTLSRAAREHYNSLTPLEAFVVGDEITGKVVRTSNYGVFVEFGAEVTGFLHKRKMAVSPKRRALKPWEINPIGSDLTAFIAEVDLDRRRVGLSTYSPDQWADALPSPPRMVKTSDGRYLPAGDATSGAITYVGVGADGDDADAAALFSNDALERQLATSLGDDDDEYDDEDDETDSFAQRNRRSMLMHQDDDDDDDEDEDNDYEGSGASDVMFDTRGEDLSAAEVRALMKASARGSRTGTGAGAMYSKIVIDDIGASASGGTAGTTTATTTATTEFDRRDRSPEAVKAFQAALAAEREVAQAMDEGEEVETEEIFAQLCPRGKSMVTMKEVRKWDYVKDLLDDGDLSEDSLRDLVMEASGPLSGKLDLSAFDDFIDLLAEELGLEEVGGVLDRADYHLGAAGVAEEKEEEEENISPSNGAAAAAAAGGGGEGVFELLPDGDQEGDIEGLDDFPESDYELIHEDEVEDNDGDDNAVEMGDEDEFVFTVETVKNGVYASASSTKDEDDDDDDDDFSIDLSIRDDDDIFGESTPTTRSSSSSGSNGGLSALVQDAPSSKPSKVAGQDILQYVFASVIEGGDPSLGASLDQCLKWDFVQALLVPTAATSRSKTGGVSRSQVIDAFHDCVSRSSRSGSGDGTAKKASTKEKNKAEAGRLSLEGFNLFMAVLTDLEGEQKASANRELIASSLVDTEEDDLLEIDLGAPLPVNVNTGKEEEEEEEEEESESGSVLIDMVSNSAFEDDDDEEWIDDEEDGDEDDEEMTIEEAFAALSEGKKTVTIAQVQEWDVIDELYAAGVLDDDELEDFFNRAGARGRGTLTLDGFEDLLDLLSPLTDAMDEEEEEQRQQVLSPVERGAKSASSSSFSGSSSADGNQVGAADTDEDDDETLLRKVFTSLSHGKERASVKDLLSWDFVLELLGEGLLTEDLLREKMNALGGNDKGIAAEHFDALVDSLVDLYADEEEYEEEGDGDDNEDGVTLSDDSHDHDDFEYDVDIDTAFQELAGPSTTISVEQLCEWELLQQVSSTN
jgi:predicted RNA-binding protein with RPS1 domain